MKDKLRRRLSVLAVLLLFCSQAGCAGSSGETAADSAMGQTVKSSLFDAEASESANATQEAASAEEQEDADEIDEMPAAPLEDAQTYSLEIPVLNGDNENVSIAYPQLDGWTAETGDLSQAQEKWNTFFQTQAENILSTLGKNDSCEITYTAVTQDKWLLSLLGEGYFFAEGAAHPYDTRVTYNIFMQTGEAATLADTADLGVVADRLMAGEAELSAEGIGMEDVFEYQGIDGTDRDAVIALLTDFDISPEKTEYPTGYSYWEGDILHLLFEIYHAAGDYVDVTLYS